VPLIAASGEQARYLTIHRSPDARTVGITHCLAAACTTTLIRDDAERIEIATPGLLIALANDAALLVGQFSDVTAFAIGDGTKLWRAETIGVYYDRYATSDGKSFVLTASEHGDGVNGRDQLRIERLDAMTGTAERSVLVSTERASLWVASSLSSDRYVAILDTVLPNPDKGPHRVQLVDLEAGELLDVELTLGGVP
jgi:hypothetical protein